VVSSGRLTVRSFQLAADRKGILAKRSKGKRRSTGSAIQRFSFVSFLFYSPGLVFFSKEVKGEKRRKRIPKLKMLLRLLFSFMLLSLYSYLIAFSSNVGIICKNRDIITCI